jgi:hypothetical protein
LLAASKPTSHARKALREYVWVREHTTHLFIRRNAVAISVLLGTHGEDWEVHRNGANHRYLPGASQHERAAGTPPIDFVSSTIHDLKDLRSALRYWLNEWGFQSRFSEV